MVEDQVYDEYTNRGYTVVRSQEFPSFRTGGKIIADLYATKGEEKIILEIVCRTKNKEQLMRLYQCAREFGAEFKVIYAKYTPLTYKNGFVGFEEAFADYLTELNPGEFTRFGLHSRVDEIEEVEFSGIAVDGDNAELSGNCIIVIATWQEEDMPEVPYYIPCEFVLEMKYDNNRWTVAKDLKLDFDTSQLD